MKNILSKIAIIVSFFFFACNNPSKEELIVGEWKFSDTNLPTNELTSEEEAELLMVKGLLKTMTISYFKDFTYETQMNIGQKNIKLNGIYKFEGDGKYLVTEGKNMSGQKENERSEIVTLNKDSLIIKSNNGVKLILIKNKE